MIRRPGEDLDFTLFDCSLDVPLKECDCGFGAGRLLALQWPVDGRHTPEHQPDFPLAAQCCIHRQGHLESRAPLGMINNFWHALSSPGPGIRRSVFRCWCISFE